MSGGDNGRMSTGYVVPHTHWDREWRYPIWKNRMLLIRFMDQLLDTLEKDPEYKCFLLDGQVVPIEDYLSVKPNEVGRVKRFIREKRIKVGPWYTLPDLYPVDGEALVRNLLKGTRAANQYGSCMKVGYNSFGWGQTAQLPQIYDGFGISFIICAKKVSKERAPESEFWWEAPDGTKILTSRLGEHARANFYFHTYLKGRYGVDCLSSDFRYEPEFSGTAIHNAGEQNWHEDYFMAESVNHYDRCYQSEGMQSAWEGTEDTIFKQDRLFLNGTDFSTPHPHLTETIRDLNADKAEEGIEFKHTTLEDYIQVIKSQVDQVSLRTIKGELRDGPACDCSGNALSSRIYLKQLNKKAQNMLVHQAEPLIAVGGMMGEDDYRGVLNKAWEYLLKVHPHDSINGVTQDKTADDVEYRLKQVMEIAQVMCDKGIENLAQKIDCTGFEKDDHLLLIWNPHPYEIEDVIKVNIDTPQKENAWSLRAFDSNGDALAVQEIARQEKMYPVHDMDARPWPYAADRHEMYVETGTVPALGYKVISFKKDRNFNRTHFYWMPMRKTEGRFICRSGNQLENEYLQVLIRQNGTVCITDKVSGRIYDGLHYFEDSGDVGNYWAYYPPYHDRTFTTQGGNARIWCEDNGPLSATIGVQYHLILPKESYESKCGIRGEGKRSEETVDLYITSYFTLKIGSKKIDIRTLVKNNAKNHRLRVVFPTGIAAEAADASGHFTVDSRNTKPQRDKQGLYEPEMQTLPMQTFVDIHDERYGLALLSNSLTEYEYTQENEKALYLTLFRAMGNMIVTWWEAVGEFPDQNGSQLQRGMEFCYSVYPHEGNWKDAKVYEQAQCLNVPMLFYQISGKCKGYLATAQSFIRFNNKDLIFSALKKGEDRNIYILRFFNPTQEVVKSKLFISNILPIKNIWFCSLNEKRLTPIQLDSTEEGVSCQLDVKPGKIVTMEIEYGDNDIKEEIEE